MSGVSVVIPTHNRWPQMRRTLDGALGQTGVEHEVIVVDDCSSDGTSEGLAGIENDRLRFLRHEQNRGVAAARNTGIEAARHEWLAFLDDDDLWAPSKLRTQLDAAAATGAVMAYSSALVVNDRHEVIGLREAPAPGELMERLIPGNALPAGASNVLARTDAVRAAGGFDERLHQLADWDMWLRLLDEGAAAAVDEPLLAYVYHPESMLITDERNLVDEFDHLAEKHRALTKRYRIEFDRPGLWNWMAWGASRSGHRFRATGGYLRAAAGYAVRGPRTWGLESLRDAGRALLGRELMDESRGAGPDAAAEPEWLALYR
ncbi:MAG: glycosyltransferase family 2 protein [Thermoleophilaceae bacterium]